jgi:hypothetical protein
MVEMRWVKKRDQYYQDGLPTGHLGPVREVLQYRQYTPTVDASGSLTPFGSWSEWIDVPTVTEG